MKTATRSLALTLASLMLFLAASCGSAGSDETPASTTAAQTSEATTAEPEVYYLDELSDKTFDGTTFTIHAESYEQRPNFSSGEYTGAVLNDALYDREKAIEDRYKVSLELLAKDNRNKHKEIISAVQAGDDTYDLANHSLTEGANLLFVNNAITCLSDLPYLDLGREWWAQTMIANFTVNGRSYIAAGGSSPSYYLSAMVAIFNKDKAAEYKLPDMYELVLQGKWTVDKMGELMAVCYKDLNGDGAFDVDNDFIPMVESSECGRAYFVSAGGNLIERDEKGNYYLDLGSEKSIKIMDACRKVFGSRDSSVVNDATTGKIASLVNGHTMFGMTAMMFAAQELREMQDPYGVLPFPKLDEAQAEYITNGNSFAPCGSCIPRSATNTEMSALILEAMSFIGHEKIRPAIYDVTLNGKIAQDKESSQMLEIIYRDIIFDFNCAFDFAQSSKRVREYVVGTIDNFASTWASIREQADAALADVIKSINAVD